MCLEGPQGRSLIDDKHAHEYAYRACAETAPPNILFVYTQYMYMYTQQITLHCLYGAHRTLYDCLVHLDHSWGRMDFWTSQPHHWCSPRVHTHSLFSSLTLKVQPAQPYTYMYWAGAPESQLLKLPLFDGSLFVILFACHRQTPVHTESLESQSIVRSAGLIR